MDRENRNPFLPLNLINRPRNIARILEMFCTICFVHVSLLDLQNHLRMHYVSTGDDRHRCRYCEYEVNYESRINDHVKSHMFYVVRCLICSTVFQSPSDIAEHFRNNRCSYLEHNHLQINTRQNIVNPTPLSITHVYVEGMANALRGFEESNGHSSTPPSPIWE